MYQSYEEFRAKIKELVGQDHLEEAIKILEIQAKEKKICSLEDEVAIIQGSFQSLQKQINRGNIHSEQARIERINISEAILNLGKDFKNYFPEEGIKDAVNPTLPKKRKLLIPLLVLTVLIVFWGYFFYMRHNDGPMRRECNSVKEEARRVLGQVAEKHRVNTNQYDDLRYIAIEEDLKNHIDLTTCDSIDRIKASIEFAKQFLENIRDE